MYPDFWGKKIPKGNSAISGWLNTEKFCVRNDSTKRYFFKTKNRYLIEQKPVFNWTKTGNWKYQISVFIIWIFLFTKKLFLIELVLNFFLYCNFATLNNKIVQHYNHIIDYTYIVGDRYIFGMMIQLLITFFVWRNAIATQQHWTFCCS